MLANNETGAIQPVAAIAAAAHAQGALVHCDAVQAAASCRSTALSRRRPHVAVGAQARRPARDRRAVVAPEVALQPCSAAVARKADGAAGTENVPGSSGSGRACALAAASLDAYAGLATLRDAAERRLLALAPEAQIFGATVPRLAQHACITMRMSRRDPDHRPSISPASWSARRRLLVGQGAGRATSSAAMGARPTQRAAPSA